MSKLIQQLRAMLAQEPAMTAWAVNGGAAMLIAYVFHWGPTWQASAATIVTALAAGYSALRARPAHIQVAAGSLATLLAAAATFGFNVSAHDKALILTGASVVLAFLFRQNVSPAAPPAVKK